MANIHKYTWLSAIFNIPLKDFDTLIHNYSVVTP